MDQLQLGCEGGGGMSEKQQGVINGSGSFHVS